jgi:dipeptidase E
VTVAANPGEALLCSAGVGAFGPWAADVLPDAGEVAFVDIAARPLGRPAYLADCRSAITGSGLRPIELDLAGVAPSELRAILDAANAVFVAGGYPLYLLEWARRSTFLAEVRERFAAGALAYVGVSAGAALAGPDLAPLAASDDPGQVTDTTGLGLVDFVVLPHANRRSAEELDGRRRAFGDRLDLRPLADGRALAVSGAAVREVASP